MKDETNKVYTIRSNDFPDILLYYQLMISTLMHYFLESQSSEIDFFFFFRTDKLQYVQEIFRSFFLILFKTYHFWIFVLLFFCVHSNFQEDLNNTILKSAEFGTHGVVFWGDHNDTRNCYELKDYVIKALGPAVVTAREGAQACSKRVCSGRGRCVGKILSCTSETCSCRCFRGWKGDDCSKQTSDYI